MKFPTLFACMAVLLLVSCEDDGGSNGAPYVVGVGNGGTVPMTIVLDDATAPAEAKMVYEFTVADDGFTGDQNGNLSTGELSVTYRVVVYLGAAAVDVTAPLLVVTQPLIVPTAATAGTQTFFQKVKFTATVKSEGAGSPTAKSFDIIFTVSDGNNSFQFTLDVTGEFSDVT